MQFKCYFLLDQNCGKAREKKASLLFRSRAVYVKSNQKIKPTLKPARSVVTHPPFTATPPPPQCRPAQPTCETTNKLSKGESSQYFQSINPRQGIKPGRMEKIPQPKFNPLQGIQINE